MYHTLNIGGQLLSLDRPIVMGILNLTPDSFYSGSRMLTGSAVAADDSERIARRTRQILAEGGRIIDVGACSTRPGSDEVSADEEIRRLAAGLEIIRREAPDAVISVDTFRSEVARLCVRDYGVQIVNDISGGEMDRAMFHTVGRLGVPYILMHMQGKPQDMQTSPHYNHVTADVMAYLARRAQALRDCGVNDIIVDPGFGFGKTLEHNYDMLQHLECFHELGMPLLVGVSRKSMIYKYLGGTPAESLNGTTAINVIALMKGAHILRVHDVREAVEAVKIVEACQHPETLRP